ncbi:MAG: hypothetical protein FJZ59_05710 [Chlamydiae bacterium]|jgi:hypothetical protein|nr:hypothetical protein [Chlamydiota bacterium]
MALPLGSKSKDSIKALYEAVLDNESNKKYSLSELKKMSTQFEKTFKINNNPPSSKTNEILQTIAKKDLIIYAKYAKFLGFTENEVHTLAKIIASAKNAC